MVRLGKIDEYQKFLDGSWIIMKYYVRCNKQQMLKRVKSKYEDRERERQKEREREREDALKVDNVSLNGQKSSCALLFHSQF